VWAANALGAAVCRVAPGGRIVDEIAMPEGLGVFACGLGGADGRTLIACAAPDFHEEARKAAREAVLLMTTVEVPRAGLP
jgi:sugar lactone lactonase YvrE